MHTLGQPSGSDESADWALHPPSPEAIYRWLGVRFALLEVPPYNTHTVGRSWETGTNEDDLRYSAVRLVHEIDDDTIVEVTTAKDDTGNSSLGNRLRESLINYQLGLLGRRTTFPWGTGTPPLEFFEGLEANTPPEPVGMRELSVNGTTMNNWLYFPCADMVSGQPLAACGRQLSSSLLVMVTGPDAIVRTAHLRTWPQPSSSTN